MHRPEHLMPLYERVGNLHIHTVYSDGSAEHNDLPAFAAQAGLDFLIVTDHNVYEGQYQGWHGRVLLLVGEEVHNPARSNVNHYLVLNAREELAPFGDSPQRLIDAARQCGGIGFIAHPYEHSGAFANEPEINWVDWQVHSYNGLEIWNYMSEFKAHLADLPKTLLYAYLPKLAITGPYPEVLAKWDELLALGKVTAIGGSDAHAALYHVGPLRRRVFSYRHLFGAVNTHVLVPELWSRDAARDAALVYDALSMGRAFVAYDALASARGFTFLAEHGEDAYTMGDAFLAEGPVRFVVRAPAPAHLRIILNGFCVAERRGRELIHLSRAPGAYRVEAYRPYLLKLRGWIFGNPIWIKTRRRGRA
jgi:hypothetical protein